MQEKQIKMKGSGLYTWFGYVYGFEEKLRYIKDAGFDTICTWWDNTFIGIDGDITTHKELARKHGLFLEHSHISYYGSNNLWFRTDDGDTIEKKHLEVIELAGKCDIPTLVMHPFEVVKPDGGDYEVFMDRMCRIAECAEKSRVRIAVENLGEQEYLRKIVSTLSDNPYIGICFDSGHNNVTNHNDYSLLHDFSDRIFALHIHDNNSLKDQHYLPFEGNADFGKFMEAMRNTSFTGSLMLESCYPFDFDAADTDENHEFSQPEEPVESYLRRAKEACDRIYSL
ncbi:MAG: sugar phosphate isomerase/epimerase [Eubacteriaceae bacterium]|nr:sugar phosphate isomerase/epimerase [Eubacteriaceae bacterium]